MISGNVNEGETHSYNGLHQWNFEPAEDDLFVWRREERRSLKTSIGESARIATVTRKDRPQRPGMFLYSAAVQKAA